MVNEALTEITNALNGAMAKPTDFKKGQKLSILDVEFTYTIEGWTTQDGKAGTDWEPNSHEGTWTIWHATN